ncbi:hypothetical protein GJ496_010223 [Pomphorhynchus laevis]|nr:hypothetical protein GJ496_010223 [Pomphorhynchus laevis]
MGVPTEIVSSNDPPFQSHKFNDFCHANAIRHIRSSPYHHQTNELLAINQFLLSYRNIPHSTIEKSPSEVMYGRKLMTFFYRLRSSCQGRTNTRRNLQKHQPVWLRDSISGKWNPANVKERNGWSPYRVWTNSGLRRRASNLRPRTESAQEHSLTNKDLTDFPVTKE